MEEELSEQSENSQMSEPNYESDDAYFDEDENEDEDKDEEPLLKKPKTPKLDRISSLPDSIIQHILSFLPTSKHAVKTGVLSKRWECLWTRVPNLIFYYHEYHGKVEKFFNFIDKTLILYSSSKINKFVLDFNYDAESSFDSRIGSWLRFASTHDVEELCLGFCETVQLPRYFYNNSKLLKFKSKFCNYFPNGEVCWNSLKILSITYAKFSDDAVHKILQGSPLLECLELHECSGIKNLDITSKCLKKLVINEIMDIDPEDDSMIEISAPNLQSLEILGNCYKRKFRLMNVSSLVSASLDFELTVDDEESIDFYAEYRKMLKDLLEKVDHVKELTLGTWCIQVLSISEVKNFHFPPSNRKCLILHMHFLKWDPPGLASLLHSSSKLEKLVIDMSDISSLPYTTFDMHPDLYCSYPFHENYWTSKKWIFKCLLLHLKTIEIVDPETRGHGSERFFAFLQFLLGNAKVLEKMVIVDNYYYYDRNQRRRNLYEVAQELLSFPRASPHAVILLPKVM